MVSDIGFRGFGWVCWVFVFVFWGWLFGGLLYHAAWIVKLKVAQQLVATCATGREKSAEPNARKHAGAAGSTRKQPAADTEPETNHFKRLAG